MAASLRRRREEGGWGRRREGGGPATALGERWRGADGSFDLMRDCRNPGMENWRFAGGMMGCRSAGGFQMTVHTRDTNTHIVTQTLY